MGLYYFINSCLGLWWQVSVARGAIDVYGGEVGQGRVGNRGASYYAVRFLCFSSFDVFFTN